MTGSSNDEATPTRPRRHEIVSSWASILAASAAAVGLIFTSCSVRYQGDQTKLQDETARQQFDNQAKQQARLINLRPSKEFSSKTVLVTHDYAKPHSVAIGGTLS